MTTAAELWKQLGGVHSTVLSRAQRYAKLTVPALLEEEGTADGNGVHVDFQSVGARGALHLANKLGQAQWSPTRPAFRLTHPDPRAQVPEVDEVLANIEREAVGLMDEHPIRPELVLAHLHLIVTGNALVILPEDGFVPETISLRFFRLRRRADKTFQDIIVANKVRLYDMKPEVRELLPNKKQSDEVTFYRWATRTEDGGVEVTQWVDDVKLGDEYTRRTTLGDCGWLPLTWMLPDKRSYGVGLVEMYAGDLEALSALAASGITGAAANAEMRWGIDPRGATRVEHLKGTRNGEFVSAGKDDIFPIMAENTQAIAQLLEVVKLWELRVSSAFLLTTGMMRQAERVTAEEIRTLARELDTQLGGVYSNLAHTMQRPIALWLLGKLGDEAKKLRLRVITGLDALSRSVDLENMLTAAQAASVTNTMPQELRQRIHWPRFIAAIDAATGSQLNRTLMTEEEFGQQLAAQAATRVQEAGATAAATQGAQPA